MPRPTPRNHRALLDRLKDHEQVLQDAHTQFARASAEELTFSYSAEWLLDNFYVVRQTLRQIREDMPRGYYRQLPSWTRDRWHVIPASMPSRASSFGKQMHWWMLASCGALCTPTRP